MLIFCQQPKNAILTFISVLIIYSSKEAAILLSSQPSLQLTFGLLYSGTLMAINLFTIEKN